MTDNPFKVIRGGIGIPSSVDRRTFLCAYATDTRLMGVVTMCIRWLIHCDGTEEDIYQFFYLDSEEYAIENYIKVSADDEAGIEKAERKLTGGLGGQKKELSEREASCLLSEFADMNKKRSLALPGDIKEYAFLIKDIDDFSIRERDDLFFKLSDHIENDHQLIHYFLMRVFGKDMYAASHLASSDTDITVYNDIMQATLCRNSVERDPQEEECTYMAESLIESDNTYTIAVSRLRIDDNGRISFFQRINCFDISVSEAAMKLMKPEFMTIYDISLDDCGFEIYASSLLKTAMISSHLNGKLYMIFKKDNDHVKDRIFLLNNDVYGTLFLTTADQLIAVGNSLEQIHALEKDLRRSPVSKYLRTISKYEFREAVMYDFIQSDYCDFNEYLDFIKN